MDKYNVKMLPKAERDIDEIYEYLSKKKEIPEIALSLVDIIENTILSLEYMPFRGSERKVGTYVNKGYRQVFVKNFTVVYRVDKKRHIIIIVAVRYSLREF
ncbi:MAG: type II toxin-antitoxin system RelE/ParE family toxin [Mobilitalea sp.]